MVFLDAVALPASSCSSALEARSEPYSGALDALSKPWLWSLLRKLWLWPLQAVALVSVQL